MAKIHIFDNQTKPNDFDSLNHARRFENQKIDFWSCRHTFPKKAKKILSGVAGGRVKIIDIFIITRKNISAVDPIGC